MTRTLAVFVEHGMSKQLPPFGAKLKYARIFVRGHYLFRVTNSFPRT